MYKIQILVYFEAEKSTVRVSITPAVNSSLLKIDRNFLIFLQKSYRAAGRRRSMRSEISFEEKIILV